MAKTAKGQVVLASCLLCSLLASSPFTSLHANESAETKAELDALKGKISQIQKWLSGAQGQRSQLLKELRKSELAIGRVASKIRHIVQDIRQGGKQLARLESKQLKIKSSLSLQEEQLAKQIRAAYGTGRQEYLKMLLNQEQPESLSRVLKYYDYFNRARSQEIDQYKSTLTELKDTRLAIEQAQSKLQNAKAELEGKRATLADSKKQRHIILVKLDSSIKDKGQELEKLLGNRKELERLLTAVEEALAEMTLPADATPFHKLKGKLFWPVEGRVRNRFGRKDPKTGVNWNGILIRANEGKDVKAVHHGRVVFADWLRGFGLLLILDHGDGYMSLYGYNQSLYKDIGDWVSANDVIAAVGNSGGQTQPGVYFEIRKGGTPQNPQKWIARK